MIIYLISRNKLGIALTYGFDMHFSVFLEDSGLSVGNSGMLFCAILKDRSIVTGFSL
jgi:hypothetical protein